MTRHLRGLRFRLECGHVATVSTAFYRLSRVRVSRLIGNANRGGCWCDTCRTSCMPTKVLGTTKL